MPIRIPMCNHGNTDECLSCYDEEIARLREIESNTTWQPIKTAPKDGTEILVMDSVSGVYGAVWATHRGRADWFQHRNMGWIPAACYWMPIPPAPNATVGG
jgi:hypothetical protein